MSGQWKNHAGALGVFEDTTMKMVMVRWAMLAAGAAIAGCHSTSVLNQRYVPARADLSDIQLPVPATGTPTATENPEPTDRQPLPVQQVITGTWTFTTPTTVTLPLEKNGQIMQYALFAGLPAPSGLTLNANV